MEAEREAIGSPPVPERVVEEEMLREDVVREMLARLEQGQKVKRIARELGVTVKTVKRWRRRGQWRPRQTPAQRRALDGYAEFIRRRAPEVGWNGVVVHRELQALGFSGGYLQVQRFLQPLRSERRWASVATVRFETEPGRQAQVDFGQTRLWIADTEVTAHIFVLTLGFSRRVWARAYPNERLATVLDAHERAFQYLGGVPLECLYDNPRTLVLGRQAGSVLWHRVFEDFARYYGFTPRACQPYRARTKGKVESGVKYVKFNALAGRQFATWAHLNDWLEEWCLTIADHRLHGTTHERPIERFAREGLTPLGSRPPYRYEHVRHRPVPAGARRHRRRPLLGARRLRRRHRRRPRDTDPLRALPRQRVHCPPRQGRAPRRVDGASALRRPVPAAAGARRRAPAAMGSGLPALWHRGRARPGALRNPHGVVRRADPMTTTPQLEKLHGYCQRLRLYQLAAELPARLEQAAKKDLGYADFLDDLLTREVQSKQQKHLTMRVSMARFPFHKTLETFDFKFQPSIDAKAIRELATGRYIASGENVLLLGPPGRAT
jgi:transposase